MINMHTKTVSVFNRFPKSCKTCILMVGIQYRYDTCIFSDSDVVNMDIEVEKEKAIKHW